MTQKVLVVEDTELLRRMYADSLRSDGYEVITALDGMDAIAALRNETPDVILLDLIMPRLGGLDTLRQVKADPRLKSIPVLVLSNLGQDSDIQLALELGAVDYMIKNDVRPSDISLRINTLLRARGAGAGESASYRVYLRDREGDADRLVKDAGLSRRLWCPACEVELQLVLVPRPGGEGWYDAHFECPTCKKQY